MPVALPTLRDHRAFRCVQGRKQCRRPVTTVIVRYALDVADPHRQHRLRAFERLDLTLFIHAQNHSIFRWIQVQPYNIPYFLYKKWIGRELEMFLPVRLQPKACQMRCTVDFDTRVCSAICRTLQCVPSFGFVSSVLRTNCATRSSLIGRGRPGRNSSRNPDTSCSRNRCRHLPTVALVSPIWRAICIFVFPEALSKTILARLTSPAGSDRELARLSSCSRCCGLKTNTAFGRPIAIGIPHSALEMPIFPAILLPFIYGTGH